MAAGGVRTLLVKFTGDATGLNKTSDDAAKKLEKGKGAFGKLNKAATLAALAVAGGIAAWGVSTFQALGEIERLRAQTESALESMNVAWTDTAEIEAYAGAIEKATGIEAELVQEGQNLLLTFGNIQNAAGKGNNIFDRSTSIMTDMSVALGQDMSSSATQLGKALNDPIKGVTALQRVGVSFTESQKDQIKALVESGDTLGAQKLILGELENQFGGSAEAFGETMPGQIAKAKNAFGEMSENLLVSLMPTIQSLVEKFMSLTDWMMKNQGTVKAIAITVAALAGAILLINAAMAVWRAMVVVATAVQWLWNIAMTANPIGLIILAIVALIAVIVLIIANWDTVKRVFLEVWGRIWADLKRFGAWIADVFWKNGLKKYFELWGNIIGWVRDKFAAGVDRIKGFVSSLLERILGLPGKVKDGLAKIGEFIAAPFRAGFGAAKDAWNNTVGGKGFDIPSWVPGLGGKSFRFPRFHSGGIVPGPAGREVPILAQAGEAVLTREQQDALGGGQFEGTLVLDSGEFLGVVRGVLRRAGGQTRRAALAGAGAAR